MKKNNILIVCLFLIFLFCTVAHFHNHYSHISSLLTSSDKSKELTSNQKIVKQERESSLGQPKVVVKKLEKQDKDIALSDISFAKKWGLNLTDSYRAWKQHKVKGEGIVVAVIDTGIDLDHVEFKDRLWVNKGEFGLDELGRDKSSNGVDDDKNGYVDDVHGWNFVHSNNDVTDNHGHGTHISGIIGARGMTVSGVAPDVSLMVLKYYDSKGGGGSLEFTINSIRYAVKMGAHIINYSGGGTQPNSLEKKAIKEAQERGILFVAAAGNEYSNSDISNYYPADYELNNIISVTAIDESKHVLESSNYGVKTVDIAAPGKRIYSTLHNGLYGYMTGTSQATGFVTGVTALIMSRFKDFPPSRVIEHLTKTGDYYEHLQDKTGYGKKLNTYKALSILGEGVGVTGGVISDVQNLGSFTTQGLKRTNPSENSLIQSLKSLRKINSAKKP